VIEEKQPLFDHVSELRTRLLWAIGAMLIGTAISYHFAKDIYGFLVKPLADAMGGEGTQRLIYTDLTEAFFTYLKVALFSGTFFTFPFLILQVWLFVAPGLFPKEKKTILPFLVASPLLFILGGTIVYYAVLPMAWKFFLSFQSGGDTTTLPIMLEAKVGDYLNLVMTLIFAFGLCFQMPVIMAFLAKAGMITAKTLVSKRRYAIVGIFVVAAILTPPDVISQFSLAVPLMGLYEISILLVRYLNPDESAATHSSHESNAA
jgi:sec-independent protein translocase protein TatC